MTWLVPATLWGTALLCARLLPLGLLLALLTRGLVPVSVALALVLALAAGLAPTAPLMPADAASLVASVSREACVGLAFALACATPLLALFWSTRVGEQLVWSAQGVPMARLYVWAAGLLLLALGGHRALLAALARGLVDVPLGQVAVQRAPLLVAVGRIVGDAFAAALALGLPLWFSLWLLDLTYALIERLRAEPQPLTRAPVRALLAQLLIVLLFAPLVSRMPEQLRIGLDRAGSVLRQVTR